MRAVLWDLDGTLVDSEEYHWYAWRDTMAEEGVHLSYGQFLETFGWRNDAIIPRWLPDASPEQVARIGEEKEVRYRDMVRERGLEPLAGAADWVRRLRDAGFRQAVASSAPRANIEVVLDVTGLAPFFDACISAEDVRNGKPDPEVFLKAAEKLRVPPARCVVVEDAPAGIEAARRAGMKSVGVSHGKRDLDGDVVVHSLRALPDLAFDKLVP